VDYRRYRLLQILRVYTWLILDGESAKPCKDDLWKRLDFREKCLGVCLLLVTKMAGQMPSRRRQQAVSLLFVLTGVSMFYFPKKIRGRYKNILDVHERIDPLASRVTPVEIHNESSG
jgi:hypothetical protein